MLKLARDVFDWNSHGVIYWLLAGPLFAGYVLAGVPWLVLAARDGFTNRRLIWMKARPWIFVLIAAVAVVLAMVALESTGG